MTVTPDRKLSLTRVIDRGLEKSSKKKDRRIKYNDIPGNFVLEKRTIFTCEKNDSYKKRTVLENLDVENCFDLNDSENVRSVEENLTQMKKYAIKKKK